MDELRNHKENEHGCVIQNTSQHYKNQTGFDSEGKPAVHPDHGHFLIQVQQSFTTNSSSILSETPSDCPKPDNELYQ